MDDSQDKVRRNLVVFSATIITYQYLGLKLNEISKLFNEVEFHNVNPFKLWIVIFIVLTYLFLRYWFDDKTIIQRNNLLEEYEQFRLKYLNIFLNSKLRKISKNQISTEPFSISLSNSIKEGIENFLNHYSDEYKLNVIIKLSVTSPWIPEGLTNEPLARRNWQGEIGISEKYSLNKSKKYVSSTGQQHKFVINNLGKLWVRIHAVINALFYSKSSIDFIVPLFLTFSAFLICSYKLISAFLGAST